jgi:hypothetical protein
MAGNAGTFRVVRPYQPPVRIDQSDASQDSTLKYPLGLVPWQRTPSSNFWAGQRRPVIDQSTQTVPDLELELTHAVLGNRPWRRDTVETYWEQRRYTIDESSPDLEAELTHRQLVQPLPARLYATEYWAQRRAIIDQSAQFPPDLETELTHPPLGLKPWQRPFLSGYITPQRRYTIDESSPDLEAELTHPNLAKPFSPRARDLQYWLQRPIKADQSVPPDLELELTHAVLGLRQWLRATSTAVWNQRRPVIDQSDQNPPDLELELTHQPLGQRQWQRKPSSNTWYQLHPRADQSVADLELELTHSPLGQRMHWQQRKSFAYWLQRIAKADQSTPPAFVAQGSEIYAWGQFMWGGAIPAAAFVLVLVPPVGILLDNDGKSTVTLDNEGGTSINLDHDGIAGLWKGGVRVTDFWIKRNDTLSPISGQLTDALGNHPSLAGATVLIKAKDMAGNILFSSTATVTDATNSLISYTFTAPQTAVAVEGLLEFQVTFAGGAIQTFPNDGFIALHILEDVS